MIPGHPFKGGVVMSTGQLMHPDLKRFMIPTPILFLPPFPGKNPYECAVQPQVPTFSDFFSSYFGTQNLNINNEKCQKFVDGMVKVTYIHL